MWGRLIDHYMYPELMHPAAACGCRRWLLPRVNCSRAVGITLCTVIIAACARSGAAELVRRDISLAASSPSYNLHDTLPGPNGSVSGNDGFDGVLALSVGLRYAPAPPASSLGGVVSGDISGSDQYHSDPTVGFSYRPFTAPWRLE